MRHRRHHCLQQLFYQTRASVRNLGQHFLLGAELITCWIKAASPTAQTATRNGVEAKLGKQTLHSGANGAITDLVCFFNRK